MGVNGRMRIREDDDHRSMEICDVAPEDAGLYRITVENKYGKIQASARLEVFGKLLLFLFIFHYVQTLPFNYERTGHRVRLARARFRTVH